MSRPHINLETKLASALLIVGQIPHDHAKLMTAKQVLSLFQWHHYPIPKDNDGPDVHWNIQPEFIKPHREYEATTGTPQRAKADRLAAGRKPSAHKIPARVNPWPEGRKIQSRGFTPVKAGRAR